MSASIGATLLPCPHCGRAPRLREEYRYVTGGESLVTYWYECRQWYRRRPCMVGERHTCTKDWADLALREATRRWNENAL